MHPSTAPDQNIDRSDDLAESIIAEPRRESDANARITYRRPRQAEDLSRRLYGRWFVLSRAPDAVQPSGKRRTMWNCICECGYRAQIGARPLVSGGTLSCGCLRAELMRAKRKLPPPAIRVRKAYGRRKEIDLTDERFGWWTVKAAAADITMSGGQKRRAWSCECRCGARKDVVEDSLLRGKSRSCGCLRREVLTEARRLARLRRQVAGIAAAVSS